MLLRQAESILAKARKAADRAGSRVKIIPEGESDNRKTRKTKAAFLRNFENNLSIKESARLVGIDRTTHYDWLRKDEKYEAAFHSALSIATDRVTDRLVDLALNGVFKPLFYKGRLCYAARIRILCELADGTSAFQDELPKKAKITGSRMVTTHDGKMLGTTKISQGALIKLLEVWFPEDFGVRRRVRDKKAPAPAPDHRQILLRKISAMYEREDAQA